MAISEAQLDTWSKQGSVTQSKNTYATVKAALEEAGSDYSNRSYSIFLQGSYGNDTNIYSDSDVDVVILLDDLFYTDLSNLTPEEKALYESGRSGAGYTYDEFKVAVIKQLKKKFGAAVKPGKKAILIEGNGSRRDCDVLVAAEVRRYNSYKHHGDTNYNVGICFWTQDGNRIINFPKQHSENCTNKHQNTNNWFKPSVRIIKNMRNSMIGKGYLKDGIAPSYFLEGMLWNVPNINFGGSYEDTIVKSINWVINCDRTKLACANDLYWLCRPNSSVCWTTENLQTFLDAAVKFWKDS